ncbi:Thiamine pyrophosphate-requiring enzyme (comE) [Nitrosopumilaceae archaeon]|nr:Thiamine pyrophosphate-requiring enzyme (comE) [Nitrosopumilaceae archaeon]
MIRREAVGIVARHMGDDPAVSANGFISRDLHGVLDRGSNFYMIGSMGLASSIAAGIAIRNPKRRVFVLDGDGNLLMNLGSLATIGSMKLNLVHVVFDNRAHESTGGQPTAAGRVDLGKIAMAAGYKTHYARTGAELDNVMKRAARAKGPIFVLVRVRTGGEKSGRVAIAPGDIRRRFESSL